MNTNVKRVWDISVDDLSKYPVWNQLDFDEQGEMLVSPEIALPTILSWRMLVAIQVELASSEKIWALMGNISPAGEDAFENLIKISFRLGEKWFHLARHFDPEYPRLGPEALARAVGLSLSDVFPIRYDIRPYFIDAPHYFSGALQIHPRTKLTREQMRQLAWHS